MPNVFASEEDCKSKLGKRMQAFRCDRPSEWLMDEFIREVEKLDDKLKKCLCALADAEINEHLQDEMRELIFKD